MILLTVGTQLPFDRLVRDVDAWAGQWKGRRVVAQVGNSSFQPRHLSQQPFFDAMELENLFRQADAIVSHAGMGSILSAMKHRKPIIVMPRRADMGEHRNDHQIATAQHLQDRPGIHVAWDSRQLTEALNRIHALPPGMLASEHADPAFLKKLRAALLA